MPLIDILVPEEVGPVEECIVVTWLKREGDHVNEGDDLLVLQADKTSYDIPAPQTGTLSKILVQQGDIVKQDQPLAQLEVSEQASKPKPDDTQPTPDPVALPPTPPRDVRASPIAKRLAREHGLDLTQIIGSGKEGRITEKDVQAALEAKADAQASIAGSEPSPQPKVEVRASPVAKRIAKEYGINLADVSGAGERRITEKDVQAFIDAQESQASKTTEPEVEAQTIPMVGMRATIAKRMHQSLQEMAQLTLHTEADVTELVALRTARKAEMPLTYTDLIVKAAALALRQHPHLNTSLIDGVIKYHPEIHIGLAVALDDGLIVPVLRQADQQSLTALVQERRRLIERAKANQLTPNDYTGGTFTITNLGTYDIDAFTPIVNPPEAGILGVGRIIERVVIYNGKIAQRSMMTLSLSFDHRLVDGAPAAAFLQTIKQHLENPSDL